MNVKGYLPGSAWPGELHVRRDKHTLVVTRADQYVSASAALLAECEQAGLLVDGVLTIGTEGCALGVVRYRVGPAAIAAYRAMTRLEDE